MSEAKQVIVMKKFPSLRTGKYCAQSAHASMGSLLSIASFDDTGENLIIPLKDPFVKAWLIGRFKKIALYVETDAALVEIYNAASAAGLPVAIIKDAGLTEFDGHATLTAVGIGPADPASIDKITGHLKLF